ncbi:MAG: hypothetical protein H6631_07185 [Anaerolineaceae bacterium]|nr:hypothetical protein [Anaerolineaceae bacterium]MCB9097922.1 hypothetical protein [Anaerolineales bacterium]
MITLTLTDQERETLEDLLRTTYSQKRRELLSTTTGNGKQALLNQQLEQVESILFMLTHSLEPTM